MTDEKKPAEQGENKSAETVGKMDASKTPAGATQKIKSPSGSAFFEAQEAIPTGETYQPSEDEVKRRSKRNIAIALGILGFIVLVYSITVLRISQNIPGAAS